MKITTCSICGKKFIKMPCSIYKIQFADKMYYCCGYNCHQIALKAKEEQYGNEYKYSNKKERYK